MRRKCMVVLLLCSMAFLFSFFQQPPPAPQQIVQTYYIQRFQNFLQQLGGLREAVAGGAATTLVRKKFLNTRLAYKQLEVILEYYFDGDVKFFNGLAVNFIEEEDPTAYQAPQGLQMIETFLYPAIQAKKKNELLGYIDKLQTVSSGLAANPALFYPEDFLPDAIMEELYRILALGISGFDSPLAKYSLPEAAAAFNSIDFIIKAYRQQWRPVTPRNYDKALHLLDGIAVYLKKNNDFVHFNRMAFITGYLNPLCDVMGAIKLKTGAKENPIHYALVKRTGNLFMESSLDRNRYLYTDSSSKPMILLGKKLFYEPLLSVNGKRSCGSCHVPAKAFTDGLPRALQLDGHSTLPRNTPTLWNASLQINLFYDSRHVRLEDVVKEVLGNEKEMNNGSKAAVSALQSAATYQRLFKEAFSGRDTAITENTVARSIAVYIRTLVSYNARFDRYMRGEKGSMNAAEINGFNLFMGKAKCGTCHYTPLFNGSKPPSYYYQESEVLGVPAATGTAQPQLDADPGRMMTLPFDFLNHAFKTPTLRNIALTAPYMHNGVFATLEQVIDFYDKGGGQGLGLKVPNQTLPPEKLLLTANEKKDVKAFLLTLTDTSAAH